MKFHNAIRPPSDQSSRRRDVQSLDSSRVALIGKAGPPESRTSCGNQGFVCIMSIRGISRFAHAISGTNDDR